MTRLKELRTLKLRDTWITDRGLKYLGGFKKLQLLDVSRTGVTEAGINELRKVFPDLVEY